MRMLVTEGWLLWSPPYSKSSGSPNPVIDPARCSSRLARFCSHGHKHMPGINLITTVTDFLREVLKRTEPPSSSIALIMLTPCLKNLSCRLQIHSNSLAWYLRSHNWGPTCFNPALSWTLEHVYLNILQMLTPLSLNLFCFAWWLTLVFPSHHPILTFFKEHLTHHLLHKLSLQLWLLLLLNFSRTFCTAHL